VATSLGSLVVSLGLNAADYTAGLTKAELQAQRFAKSVNTSFKAIGGILAGLSIGTELVSATEDIISAASALNDLSDATGSSVEDLSRLSNQAKIAGADFGQLQAILLKLSVGMAGAGEEGSKAGQALKALGVTATDPAQALQEIAISLNKYEDGVNKAAIAVALFGKQGTAFLATLKDIAELQDVGATVTKKQAEEAENLEKAWRRLSVESEGFKNLILNSLVPALLDMIEVMREGSKIAGGFWAAVSMGLFGKGDPFETTQQGIDRLQAELAELKKQADAGGIFDRFSEDAGKQIDAVTKKLQLLKFIQRQEANKLISPSNFDQNDRLANRKPAAPGLPKDTKAGGAARISDAERLVKALEQQVQRTQELTAEETLQLQIEAGIAGWTPAIEARARAAAQYLDIVKETDEWVRKSAKDFEETKAALAKEAAERAAATKAQEDQVENLIQGNQALEDEITLITGGEEALKKVTEARIRLTLAQVEDYLAKQKLNDATESEILLTELQIEQLRKRLNLLKDKDVAIALKADADAVQALRDTLADSFADSFEGFIMGTKSASQAFKDFANDIERYLLKIALHKLGDQMFGGATSGSGDLFGSIFAQLFGSSGGVGFEGLGGFARGTPYAPGGLAVVGEHGPELVDMPRGARVWPNGTGPKAANDSVVQVENHFHVTGTINSATVRQIERGVGDSVMRNRMDR
jgi:hypothetical protein